jgi:hypothetical protein
MFERRFNLLIKLIQEREAIKILKGKLRLAETQIHTIEILKFFLFGFQLSPIYFHSCVDLFIKMLTESENKSFLLNLLNTSLILMKMHPGHPLVYEKLNQALENVKETKLLAEDKKSEEEKGEKKDKFVVTIISEDEIEAHIKKFSWINLSQTGFGNNAYQSFNQTEDLSVKNQNYKGLWNLGNSKFALYNNLN